MNTQSIDHASAYIHCKHISNKALEEAKEIRKSTEFLRASEKELPLIRVFFPGNGSVETFDVRDYNIQEGPILFITMKLPSPRSISCLLIPFLKIQWSGFSSVCESLEINCHPNCHPNIPPNEIPAHITFEPGSIKLMGFLQGDIAGLKNTLEDFRDDRISIIDIRRNTEALDDIRFEISGVNFNGFIANGINSVKENPKPPSEVLENHPTFELLKTTRTKYPTFAAMLNKASNTLKNAIAKRDSLVPYEDHFRILRVKHENGVTVDLDITKGRKGIDNFIAKDNAITTFWEVKPTKEKRFPLHALARKLSFAFGTIQFVDSKRLDGRIFFRIETTGIRVSHLSNGFQCHARFSYDSTIREFGPFDESLSKRIQATVSDEESAGVQILPKTVCVKLDAVRVGLIPLLPRLDFLGLPMECFREHPWPDAMKIPRSPGQNHSEPKEYCKEKSLNSFLEFLPKYDPNDFLPGDDSEPSSDETTEAK